MDYDVAIMGAAGPTGLMAPFRVARRGVSGRLRPAARHRNPVPERWPLDVVGPRAPEGTFLGGRLVSGRVAGRAA